jgi:hypothetical protein
MGFGPEGRGGPDDVFDVRGAQRREATPGAVASPPDLASPPGHDRPAWNPTDASTVSRNEPVDVMQVVSTREFAAMVSGAPGRSWPLPRRSALRGRTWRWFATIAAASRFPKRTRCFAVTFCGKMSCRIRTWRTEPIPTGPFAGRRSRKRLVDWDRLGPRPASCRFATRTTRTLSGPPGGPSSFPETNRSFCRNLWPEKQLPDPTLAHRADSDGIPRPSPLLGESPTIRHPRPPRSPRMPGAGNPETNRLARRKSFSGLNLLSGELAHPRRTGRRTAVADRPANRL